MKGRIVILKIETDEKDANTVALNIFEHCYLPGYDSRSFRDDGIFVTLDEIDNSALAEFRTHGKFVYNVATGREIKCKHFKKICYKIVNVHQQQNQKSFVCHVNSVP